MKFEDEFFFKQVQISYELESNLERSKKHICNLFLMCTCTTILGTSYTLMHQSLEPTIIYPVISYMSFFHILKELIIRNETEKMYHAYKQFYKMKKIY